MEKLNISQKDAKFKSDLIKVIEGAELPWPMLRYGLKEVLQLVESNYINEIKKVEETEEPKEDSEPNK